MIRIRRTTLLGLLLIGSLLVTAGEFDAASARFTTVNIQNGVMRIEGDSGPHSIGVAFTQVTDTKAERMGAGLGCRDQFTPPFGVSWSATVVYCYAPFKRAVVTVGSADDRVESQVPVTVNGNGGADKIFGSPSKDELRGGDGKDLITGGGDSDSIYGGPGADRIDSFDPIAGTFLAWPDNLICGQGKDYYHANFTIWSDSVLDCEYPY